MMESFVHVLDIRVRHNVAGSKAKRLVDRYHFSSRYVNLNYGFDLKQGFIWEVTKTYVYIYIAMGFLDTHILINLLPINILSIIRDEFLFMT